MNTYLKYIVTAAVAFLGGVLLSYAVITHKTVEIKGIKEDKVESTIDTTVTVKPKDKETDPDLKLEQHYTADINGHKVIIPVVPKENQKGDQVTIRQQIDMTPAIKELAESRYKRNWEIGTGIGYNKTTHFYLPISVQRNYNKDRALELQVNINKKGSPEGYQIMHKWKF